MKYTLALTAALLLATSSLVAAQTAGQGSSAPTVDLQQGYPIGPEAAKQYIEALGYTDVQNLVKDSDGWHATANKNGRQVNIDLDTAGKVREE